jgi:signal transduction histidine kinase/ActR/RegA family two-component response regulator
VILSYQTPEHAELEYRLRQQALLAELGRRALGDITIEGLLDEAVRLAAVGLNTRFCKVLEYLPDQNRLLVRAGVGWHEGVVGAATVGADLGSPAGYAMHTGKPVISNDLANDNRFRTPELLAQHSISRAINVILMGNGKAFGVLEADGLTQGAFSEHDIDFLQSVANLLGAAIDRIRALEALHQLNETLEERIAAEVAERRQTETILHQAQKMEAIGQLTGGVAHDFNNLLMVVTGGLGLLAKRLDNDPKSTELMGAIKKAAARGEQLTSQLLAFARRQTLRPEPRNLNSLIHEFDVLAGRILGESIEITMDLDENVGACNVDAAQFGSSLLNLIVNARDAMPRGGKVTVRTRKVAIDTHAARLLDPGALPGDYAMVEVEDNGLGMSPDVRARALEPFFTTKEPGRGTGLGLSQVYGFMRQSDGFLTIDSAPGQGTTVRLYFQCIPETELHRPQPEDGDSLMGGSETVLVVEDDEDVRSITVQFLETLGYHALTARDAQEALELTARAPVDLVVTDIVMPGGMSGVDLARELRGRNPAIRVILATGYAAGNENVRKADGTREFPVLAKPYQQADIARAVRAALDRDRGEP